MALWLCGSRGRLALRPVDAPSRREKLVPRAAKLLFRTLDIAMVDGLIVGVVNAPIFRHGRRPAPLPGLLKAVGFRAAFQAL